MDNKTPAFGELFKKARLRAGFATLAEFGEKLANEGLIFEDSLFSRWQKGSRAPKDRGTLLKILKVFINNSGVSSLKEANSFLEVSGQGHLTESESQALTRPSKSFAKLPSPKKIIRFLTMTGKSKKILRSGWTRENIKNPESVAEHSFRLSVLAMVLSDHLSVDREKLIKMAILHDLGEVVTGDLVWSRGGIVDMKKRAEKERLEAEGIKKVFRTIGKSDEYKKIFEEMIARTSQEAKIFWQLDKLEMAFQALEYEKEQNKKLDEFFINANLQIDSPALRKILRAILKDRTLRVQRNI